jgi:hypothetical protein
MANMCIRMKKLCSLSILPNTWKTASENAIQNYSPNGMDYVFLRPRAPIVVKIGS